MRLFKCQACGQTVFFENRRCARCGHELGYLPEAQQIVALKAQGCILVPAKGRMQKFRYCANATHDACNWLIQAEATTEFCAACRYNRTIPDLTQDNNLLHWQRMETAKHRLFYSLLALRLPLTSYVDDPAHGLAFDFLADAGDGAKILTGHDDGLITINLAEADDARREQSRVEMHEPYRTLLGHFRHEIGHYFWNVLIGNGGRLESCRAAFGDDSTDYAAALQRHYEQGPPADWAQTFITAYAAVHPWEDFAETWAHYLHIVDTLETASAFGLRIHPTATKSRVLHADIDFDPHHAADAQSLIEAWLPLTFAVNSLNRSMGLADLYPFVLSPAVIEKLQFIHMTVQAGAQPAVPDKPGLFGAADPKQPPGAVSREEGFFL
ncbi:zinc-binding metallopeptidase family protein [Acidocella sp.]|jgi:hypothetical protein|uniref:zinc-binding metallopeptidase family protein n=1 Tax=Acidocella sp. TaxID=50710 RepID=UPI002F3FB7C1